MQTPFPPKELERRCKNILRNWKTGIDEAGINYLFLAMGFLEWHESESSDIKNRAPLILVPIGIERSRLNKKSDCYNYMITYSGEDIEINITLLEKLERDFGLTLPQINEDFSVENYFDQSSNIFDKISGWRVVREMFVGFFSFAKLRLYKDLSLDSWPNEKHFIDRENLKEILIGRDKSEKGADPSYSEEYTIDENAFAEDIPLVLDADSSQHSAIIDVVIHGKNIVIEGPPGTGKSQTISNVIASSLYKDKTVLFVSEKKAALEVVRNRLNFLGLGVFCLELHSHKTQKGLLHADIKSRLSKTFTDTRELDNKKEQFRTERRRLQVIYDLLRSKPGVTGESIYEILGASEKWKLEIEDEYFKLDINEPLKVSLYEKTSIVNLLEDFVRVYGEIPPNIIDLWSGYEPVRLLPGDENLIHIEIESLLNAVNRTKLIVKEAIDEKGFIEVDLSFKVLESLANANVNTLTNRPDNIFSGIASNFLSKRAHVTLETLANYINKYKSYSGTVKSGITDYETTDIESLKKIAKACQALVRLNYAEESVITLYELTDLIPRTIDKINILNEVLIPIKDFLFTNPQTFQSFETFRELANLIDNSPPELSLHYHKEHGLKLAKTYHDDANKTFDELFKQNEKLSKYFDINKALPEKEIKSIIEILLEYQGKFKRFFSSKYRKARNTIKVFLIGNKYKKDTDYVQLLNELAEYEKKVLKYSNNADFKKVLGPIFDGLDTNWELLTDVLTFSQKLIETLHSESCTVCFLSNFLMNKEKVSKIISTSNSIYLQTINELKRVNISIKIKDVFKDLISKLENIRETLIIHYNKIPNEHKASKIKILALKDLFYKAVLCKEIEKRLMTNDEFKKILGNEYKEINTPIRLLKETAYWVKELKENSNLNTDIIEWILDGEIPDNISLILNLIDTIRNYVKCFKNFIEYFKDGGVSDFNKFLNTNSDIDNLHLKEIEKTISGMYDTTNYLIQWSDYVNIKRKVFEAGMHAIIVGVESGHISPNKVKAYYLHSLYYYMMIECMKRYNDLSNFLGVTYDNIRDRIAKLDEEIKSLNLQHISYQISKRHVPLGISSGYVRNYTDFGLIEHELNKKKRHIPIRQLVRRSGNALQALKPCFMMSPQSVAQYLIPGEISFDVVVMDEASQLKLEDAIGAVARSTQVVVVGDPKQLPPSSFFDRIRNIEIGDDATAAEEAESILDVCQDCFTNRRLRWHYRSEHDDLISFSNNEFYDNDLIVFPSPLRSNDFYGVHYKYIDNAIYYKGKNVKEARTVAVAIMDHFDKNSGLSLGVATFNIQQRNIIYDELESLQKEHSWLEKRIKMTENHVEPFFIKNLENVQGDERDIIFISTTYGPDRDTKRVYQRFGPLNTEMGWRRLNVIITRAKKRVVLFSSMTASDIIINENTVRGPVALKKYIEYAKTNQIPEYGRITGREPDSDFEIAVSKALHQYGYKTEYQVGVAGFFIDIGVYNPNADGEFILGIECDGAAYHSAKSIRDRDILRQRVLENKGWKIHRIWSTDWFKDKDKQLQKVLSILKELVTEDTAQRATETKESEFSEVVESTEESLLDDFEDSSAESPIIKDSVDDDDKLRNELLEYRTKVLEPITRDPERSLLSDKMIKIFLLKKPTSREEFLGLPLSFREAIEHGQMDYIDEVFEIMEDYV